MSDAQDGPRGQQERGRPAVVEQPDDLDGQRGEEQRAPAAAEPPVGERSDERAPPEEGSREQPTRRWWPVLLPAMVVLVVISLVLPAGRHWWAVSLLRKQTAYTALSFNNPAALPAKAARSAPLRISFTISNREGRAQVYRYFLSDGDSIGGSRSVVGSAARRVASGANWTVSTVVRPACATGQCRVQVSLAGHPETIDFLIALTS